MAHLGLIESEPSNKPFIGFIQTRFPSPHGGPGGLELGTGTLIAPRVVLTAGHIVFDATQGGQALSVDILFGNGMAITTTTVDFPLEWRNAQPGSFANSIHSHADIGVIVLPEPIDRFISPIPFETAGTTQLAGMSLNVAGYPAFPPENRPRGTLWGRNCPLLQGDTIPDDLREFSSFRLFYPVSTLPGMSGGPLYDFNSSSGIRTIRGIHTAGPTPESPLFPGSALRITEDVFQLIQTWITTFRPS